VGVGKCPLDLQVAKGIPSDVVPLRERIFDKKRVKVIWDSMIKRVLIHLLHRLRLDEGGRTGNKDGRSQCGLGCTPSIITSLVAKAISSEETLAGRRTCMLRNERRCRCFPHGAMRRRSSRLYARCRILWSSKVLSTTNADPRRPRIKLKRKRRKKMCELGMTAQTLAIDHMNLHGCRKSRETP
jgi:hypothetical protein